MRRKTLRNKGLCIFMSIVILVSTGIIPSLRAEAATTYITVESFSELLANELGLSSIDGSTQYGYVNALLDKGIIKDGDFTSYTKNITRGDTMVLLNRGDEYLYGDKTEAKLVQTVIDKRISDIGKVIQDKREDVSKAYIKGYMKGYSNGTYCTDRSMKVTSKITKSGALSCIKLIKDKSLRAKISPDGQLIRTTNLPISYKKFPYILASYPNTYYDWKLIYEIGRGYSISNGKKIPHENLVDYAAPVDVDNVKGVKDYYVGFGRIKDKYLDVWVDKAQTYLEHIFSANYKTIDDEWVEEVMKTDYSYGYAIEDSTRKELKQYVVDMKANKTIVEYSKIRVDGSSMYFYNSNFYLRAYVKYRIVSSEVKYGVDTDTLIMEKPYNDILWSRNCTVDFTDFTLGEWRECGYDIAVSAYEVSTDKGVSTAYLDEYYCKQYQITK